MDGTITELAGLLASVRLGLEADGEGWIVTYERERHPVRRLPLDDLDASARAAELLAVAAGLEAAVKFPGETTDEDFRAGAATLLPRVERSRFVAAYDAVLEARGADDGDRLFHRALGAGLALLYVKDEGWRFQHVTQGQAARWAVTPGTVDAGARSNLYHRHALPHDRHDVAIGDGYDASRLVVVDDVFYHLAGADGLPVAAPDRDRLLVGPAATAEATAEAYAAARYPLCPTPLVFQRGSVRAR